MDYQKQMKKENEEENEEDELNKIIGNSEVSSSASSLIYNESVSDDASIELITQLAKMLLLDDNKQSSEPIDMDCIIAEELITEHMINKENVIRLLRSYLNEQKNRQVNNGSFDSLQSEGDDTNENEITLNQTKDILLSELTSHDINNNNNNNDKVKKDFDEQNFPSNLIVTSVPVEVFSNLQLKSKFEELFLDIDENCKFCFFRIFRRCSIQFSSWIAAILARIQLDNYVFMGENLKIFLNKVNKFFKIYYFHLFFSY
jgi:hypothetical protein